MILRANGCTDNPSSHSQREQYLALSGRHPIHRRRYICAGAEIHISYVSTLIVSCALDYHCLLIQSETSLRQQGLLLSMVLADRLTDVRMKQSSR